MRFFLFVISPIASEPARADESGYAAFLQEEQVLENMFEDGVMHVNGRMFWMGDLHEWPKATHDYRVSFIVRSSIWLREFLDNDPVLKNQDFVLRRTQDSSFTGARYLASQMELAPDPSLDCKTCFYDATLDPILQVEGYDTYSNGFRSLLFVPKNSAIAHGFRCSLTRENSQAGQLDICSVIVVYPYATNIVFNGRRHHPGTVLEYDPKFAAIAKRILEVIICIDITNDQSIEDYADSPSSGILENNPNLTGCRIDMTS